MSHRGFIRIVWTFENWKFRGYVFSLLCLERVTLDLRKIPQSGDMSHRGFLSIFFGHWRFWKFSGFVFFFALFGECL